VTREEFQRILRRSRGKYRFSTYLRLDDQLLSEKETAELLDPVEGEARTINIERRALCSSGHVLSDGNQPVARCRLCGGLLCATESCLEHCCSGGCGPVCSRDRWRVKGEWCCRRHVARRLLLLLLGFLAGIALHRLFPDTFRK
jgi:hypothetical protein